MPDALVVPDSITSHGSAPPPVFVCSWTDGGEDAAWVHVAGEMDISTVPQLERALRAPELQARLVVLDLRELDFMDSSGVHAIVDASRRARQAGRRLVLLRGRTNVDRMLTLSGCAGDLEIGDLDPSEPPVQMLLQLAREDLASSVPSP